MQPITPSLTAATSSDGSDKSTACEYLITVVEKYGVVGRVHLGKRAGNIGRAVIKSLLMGKSLHKIIEQNQVKTARKLPGPVPALITTALVARRLLCLRHMLTCRRRGLAVLTDHYPQDQTPGAYDGTAFPPNVEGGRFISQLASQECETFHWMASHKPDLAIKLNVDLEVARVRKSDHKRESLVRRIATMPQLTFGDA